jgi:hypothetical protein
MKKNLFIAFMLILVVTSCDKMKISENQADSFIKYYINYPEFSAADVVQVNGSGYAILGTANTYTAGTQLCLLRTDKYGNTLDTARFYGRSSDDHAYCLQAMADGGFAILGSSRNPATEKLEVYFVRTDSVGNILWSSTIGNSTNGVFGNVEAKHFEIDDQGSFIMTGYAETIGTETIKKIWLGALDKDGNQPYWSPKIYPPKDSEGRHFQILDDGSFVITGITKNSPVPSEALFAHAFILKTTSSGIITSMYYLPASTDEEGNCIRIVDNTHFLVLCTTRGVTGTDITLNYVFLNAPDPLWKKSYGGSGNDFGRSILTRDNSIYILGTTGIAGTYTAISLITADESGNQTARSDFGLGSELSGGSFEKTADGGFIISGSNKYSENSISVALIKTGPDASF